jgi:hypothetical protein
LFIGSERIWSLNSTSSYFLHISSMTWQRFWIMILQPPSKILQASLVLVAHTCNHSYLGGCDRWNYNSRPAPGGNSQDPISTNSWVRWCMPVIPDPQSRLVWEKKWDHTSKLTKAKRSGDLVQLLECLCHKLMLWVQTPYSQKKKKKKKKETGFFRVSKLANLKTKFYMLISLKAWKIHSNIRQMGVKERHY